ncbi:hypothetical protein [Flammeovirga sp. OC4]|uniref:hypothetical protein n=1 Tax=Flammeovirga sp. OC4 TaxID=1382345 RepID=UPI0005C66257|nr:hypothetical protein [Flammeovirga sp. OC4]
MNRILLVLILNLYYFNGFCEEVDVEVHIYSGPDVKAVEGQTKLYSVEFTAPGNCNTVELINSRWLIDGIVVTGQSGKYLTVTWKPEDAGENHVITFELIDAVLKNCDGGASFINSTKASVTEYVYCSGPDTESLKFSYPVSNNKNIGFVCELDLGNRFEVDQGEDFVTQHEFLLYNNITSALITDESIAEWNRTDLSEFIIRQPGEYKLVHNYKFDCNGNESEKSAGDIIFTAYKLDPDAEETKPGDYFLNEQLTKLEDNNNQIACTTPNSGGSIVYSFDYSKKYKPKDTKYLDKENFILYRYGENEYEPVNSSTAVYDSFDLSDFRIFKGGSYLLKHQFFYCDEQISGERSYEFNVFHTPEPRPSNECDICDESENDYCTTAQSGYSLHPRDNFQSVALRYNTECDAELKDFPSYKDSRKNFLKVFYGNKIQLHIKSGDLISDEKYILKPLSDPSKSIEVKNGLLEFKGDFFKNGGIFKLTASSTIEPDGIFEIGSGTRTFEVFICLESLEPPRFIKKDPLVLCQEAPLKDHLLYSYGEGSGPHYGINYYRWDYDPSLIDQIDENKNSDYQDPIKLSDADIISANDYLGESWIEIRSKYEDIESDKRVTVKKITSYPSKPIPFSNNGGEAEVKNIFEVEGGNDYTYYISDFIKKDFLNEDDNRKIDYKGRLSFVDITDTKENLEERITYIDNENDNFQITSKITKKEFLVYRSIEYYQYKVNKETNKIEKVAETSILRSDPLRIIFVGKPIIHQSVICPYKYKFVNKYFTSIQGVDITYHWETETESGDDVVKGNQKNPSNNETFIFDYAEDADGSNKRYDVTLKIDYQIVEGHSNPNYNFDYELKTDGCFNEAVEIMTSFKSGGTSTNFSAPADFKFNIEEETVANTYLYKNGLSTSSMSFSDAWVMDGLHGDELTQLHNMSPWLGGKAGVWRMDKSFAYTATRAINFDIRKQGLMPVEGMTWEANAELKPTNEEGWIKTNTLTKYNKRGETLEEKDALDIHGTALYMHNGYFVKAVGANARQEELFFTSFEEGEKDQFFSNYFTYRIPVVAGKGLIAVVGEHQENLKDFLRYDRSIVMVKGVEYRNNKPSLFTHKALVSCEFDYLFTPENNIDFEKEGGKEENDKWRYTLLGLDGFGMEELQDWKGEIIAYKMDEEGKIEIHKNDLVSKINNSNSHTGMHALELGATTDVLLKQLDLKKGKKYVISAWIKIHDGADAPEQQAIATLSDYFEIEVEGETLQPEGPIVEGWQRIQGVFTYQQTLLFQGLTLSFSPNGKTVYLDDLRIYPAAGTMKTFYYHPANFRLMSTSDDNNFATYYSYDEEGNLQLLRKETTRGVMTIQEVQSKISQ